MARDWLTDLWKASYKGAPFWTERDQESGGRRIVKHQFPMRDDPYLEDLGEDLREYDLTAYVASDAADSEAAALAAACASRGPGILVMPVQGPVLVRCVSFSRDSSKDRAGYLGFNLKCTRDGASTSLISAAMSANLVFVAAETIASTVAQAFAAGLQILRQADYVVSAAVSLTQDAVAVFESVRTTEPVDAVASATQRRAIQTLFDAVPALYETGDPAKAATDLVAIARALGDAIPPAAAARAFDAIVTEPGFASALVVDAVYPTPRRRTMAENADQVLRLLRIAALTAYCEALARVPPGDRPAGITLRANVAEYFEAEIDNLPAAQIDLVHQIGALRDATIAYLSRAILDLAPVLRLEANRSMPSVFWAYRLYQDPQRAVELVARNRVVHPSFMPAQFEALAK
jgi:prophage DNA circulation protein